MLKKSSVILIGICVVAVSVLAWTVFVKPEPAPPVTPPVNGDTSDWKINIPVAGIDLQSSLEKLGVIIANKNKKHVKVYKKGLENNSSKIILEFDEYLSFDNSGNYWSGLPPSIVLSPDKKLIAFVDENGPKIYNIENKEIVSLTEKINDNNKKDDLNLFDKPPKWSNSNILNVYGFHAPKWSFDNKYISFKQSLYEGSSVGIFNIETKQYSRLEGFFGSNIKWSPVEDFIIAAGESIGYASPGLYSSVSVSDFIKLKKENIFDDQNFNLNEIVFSQDGGNIALIYNDYGDISGPDDNSYNLSFVGKNFEKIEIISDDSSTEKILPFFSAGGKSVYYIENKKMFVKYDLQNRKKSYVAILPSEINFWNSPVWTKEGYLSIIIGSRHIILDLEKHKIIYASSEYGDPITFAGFL